MVNSILYSEINAVCALILILICIKVKNSMFLQDQRQHLFKVILIATVFVVLDSVWIFINNNVFGITVVINWILNVAYFIISGLLGLYWFNFSESIQHSKLVLDKKYRIYTYIPFLILVFLTVSSLKTGWLFYIDEQNVYHRGKLYVLQLITAYGYVIFTAGKAFYLSFQTEDYRSKTDLKALASYVLPTLFAGAFQVFFPDFPVLCVGNAVGILYVFLTLQEQLVSLDALTKLNNRNQLFQYISVKLAHPREDKILYLLIMDVDYFKAINDKYGHVEGDRALVAVADCLMRLCNSHNSEAFRYGGDEFIIVCELEEYESIQDVCENIHKEIGNIQVPYPLSLSVGYTKYTPDIKNQQEFIDQADKELYKAKKNRSNADVRIRGNK